MRVLDCPNGVLFGVKKLCDVDILGTCEYNLKLVDYILIHGFSSHKMGILDATEPESTAPTSQS